MMHLPFGRADQPAVVGKMHSTTRRVIVCAAVAAPD
jgi:hypothetical protein